MCANGLNDPTSINRSLRLICFMCGITIWCSFGTNQRLLFCILASSIAAALSFFENKSAFLLLNHYLQPFQMFTCTAINNAADTGNKKTWGMLHGLSVDCLAHTDLPELR